MLPCVNLAQPLPVLPTITTRVATMDDLPFVDALQKRHSKQLGFFPRAQLEGYLKNGWMRVAEESDGGSSNVECRKDVAVDVPQSTIDRRLGYIAFRDRYQKRDELGAVFQLCVEPGRQRGLIGATLLQSAFDASAYGCKLFCCWCAQDLAANHFWESMGFVPIAYRTGSTRGRISDCRFPIADLKTSAEGEPSPSQSKIGNRKSAMPRVHIFWQKRIRHGDAATPWWYPSGTDGGALRSGRIVLPIPRGTHWSAVKPMEMSGDEPKALPAPRVKKQRNVAVPVRPANVMPGGFWFAPATTATTTAIVEAPAKRERPKTDPRLIAASRELRDRWLEQVNASPVEHVGKYDVGRRQIEGDVVDGEVVERKRLSA